ncbi:MAG: ferrous iron transporter B [Syntrophomonadaceae bacterium]|nr:ferrous iron transporter B [Syntrophomonadaceae bacterium]
MMSIVIIGNPNVGKSLVLNGLTGSREFVSNYPGTSLEVSSVPIRIGAKDILIYDTPGIYSILSPGKEPQAVRELLEREDVNLIVNIVDATNLERNLFLTLELIEMGLPVVVVVNQIDRAREIGLIIDGPMLERMIGVPAIFYSATTGEGKLKLIEALEKNQAKPPKRTARVDRCASCTGCSQARCPHDPDLERVDRARDIAAIVTSQMAKVQRIWLERLQNLVDHPVWGTITLLLIAYLGFKLLIEFISISEGPITSLLEPVSQIINEFISLFLPAGMISNVLSVAIPEGLIIPFTIVLPAMLMVSVMMSLLEDTGLLPRYSVALERVGRVFGLSGQAVIPLTLGLGCRTPAVVATRILPNEGQRFIVVTLLSIVVPCAATLGILASVISSLGASLPVIASTMLVTFLVLAFILSRSLPRQDDFIYELPPLRVPLWNNAWSKIKIRFSGFFTEILPLLLVMSIIIRAIIESGVLHVFSGMDSFTRALFGIPSEAFVAVLLTIFQRYLAPLVLLNLPLTPREATIAIVMVAISLPCLPVMVMTIRELGVRSLIKILAMGLTVSFIIGITLNLILPM